MTLGGITFANTAALWGLLAPPALVAVHFFQQRSRRLQTSTRFLIDALAPESQGGRTWERFRASRAFWLQILAVLLLVWVLAEPRWPRADSTQTVAIVLDDSMAMQAFAAEAREAAADLMAEAAGGAARTEWVVMGTDPRRPAFYRGSERVRAEAALATWRPALGTHDQEPALRLARGLVGADGVAWLVTDREEKAPADQPAVGVGRPLANVGFAGGGVLRAEDGGLAWRAVVKNQAAEPQRRVWWIESASGTSERREISLGGDSVIELSGAWPANAERAVLRLDGDGFTVDDSLPLIRPEPKRLEARIGLAGERGDFFRRLLNGIEGVNTGGSLSAALRVTDDEAAASAWPGPAIVVPAIAAASEARGLARAPVVAERHPLVDGLNWQGLLGPGAAGMKMTADDEGLLWQGESALAWLSAGPAERRRLSLNLDWEKSNVGRLSATVLLLRRYVETTRDARAGAYAANFDAGALVPLAAADREAALADQWTLAVAEGDVLRIPELELPVLRAPIEPGFFEVRRGADVLVRGASQFADARQGDFKTAARFRRAPPAGVDEALRDRNTQSDPFASWWLALAGAALLASWWPKRGATAPARTIGREVRA